MPLCKWINKSFPQIDIELSLYTYHMKMKIHYWQNKEAHYVTFAFTPSEYFIVKAMDDMDNEYRYSLNPRIKRSAYQLGDDYGRAVMYISKEQAKEMIEKLHFVQVHTNTLWN